MGLISLNDFGPKLGNSSYYGSPCIQPNRPTIVIVQIGSELLQSKQTVQIKNMDKFMEKFKDKSYLYTYEVGDFFDCILHYEHEWMDKYLP